MKIAALVYSLAAHGWAAFLFAKLGLACGGGLGYFLHVGCGMTLLAAWMSARAITED